MKKKGLLAVISGFSGAGKGTLIKKMMGDHEGYALSVSATTRSPRPGEVDGREYFFVTKEQFEEMIREDALIEYASYQDNYYGTPKAFVEKRMAEGCDVILEIEIQGAKKVRGKFPDAVLIFITPPSAQELRKRLLGRGTETVEKAEKRLRRAAEESGYMQDYDYLIVNDDLDQAAEELHSLIASQHHAMRSHAEFAEGLAEEMNREFLKEEI